MSYDECGVLTGIGSLESPLGTPEGSVAVGVIYRGDDVLATVGVLRRLSGRSDRQRKENHHTTR